MDTIFPNTREGEIIQLAWRMSASCYYITDISTEVSVEMIYINKHISNLDQDKDCDVIYMIVND